MADHLDAVETNSERVIPLSTLGDVAVENARKMFYALTMLLQGPPLLLLKRVERGNGFEAWRQLVERYEGANASRLHHMLQSIMRPKAFPLDSGGFEVALNEWEHLVQRWEALANDILNDAVKRQILLDMAPAGIRVQLTLAGHSSYEALRSAIMSYLVASRDWNATANPSDSIPTPMEVDALTPARRKAKGDAKGSGKKGSGKTQRKSGDDKAGKTCYVCGKTGHYARDCWNRQGTSDGRSSDSKGSGKGKTKGKSSGKGNGKVNSVCEEPCEGHPHADSTAVSAVTQDDHWIMMLEREAPQADLSNETGFEVCAVTLRTASGQALESYGRCDIQMQVPPITHPAKVTFEVVDVRYPILSVAGLVANGHRVTFRGQEAELRTSDGSVAPLTRIRGLWYLLAWIGTSREFVLVDSGAACHVCPPDWAARVSSWTKPSVSNDEIHSDKLAPVAEDVRDEGPQPVRQDAPLAEPMQQPKCPTPEEIARHELTHLPAATWCEACVKGRGREAPHRDQRGSMLDSVLPVIQCDYGYLTDVGEEPVIALFASCRSSTNLFATLCTQKGPKDTYVVAAFASWIWELGHVRLIIQSDGEPAILALVAAVRDKVIADGKAEQITCQTSPKGSHESNGAAERTVQQVRGMARVYLEHVREKTGSEFPPKSPWWAWALRHAAWVYNRFHVRADTRVTPYAKDQAQNIRSTCVTIWRVGFGETTWSTFAEKPDTVCVWLLVG